MDALTHHWKQWQAGKPYDAGVLHGVPVRLTDTGWKEGIEARYSQTTLDLETIPRWCAGGKPIANAVTLQGYPTAVHPRCAVYLEVLQLDHRRLHGGSNAQ